MMINVSDQPTESISGSYYRLLAGTPRFSVENVLRHASDTFAINFYSNHIEFFVSTISLGAKPDSVRNSMGLLGVTTSCRS